jgi:hypothetical protein
MAMVSAKEKAQVSEQGWAVEMAPGSAKEKVQVSEQGWVV